MKITVYSLRPFFDIPGYFTDIPGRPTFDPKHPTLYPGAEVEPVETLPAKEAQARYGRWIEQPHQVHRSGSAEGCTVTIFRFTGRTSAEVVQEHR